MWGYKTHRIVIGRDQDKYVDVYRAVWVLDDTVVAGKPVHEWARTVLVDWRLREKAGYRIIADRLTRLGVPTPRGKEGWSDSTVHSLLGEFDKVYQYAGYGFWNRRNWQSGFCKDRDKAEWLVVENAHPAIITEDECDKLYSMVGLPLGKRPAPKPKSRWLLSNGALVCARCGSKFAGKKTDNDYYLCGTHIYRRGAGCGPSWYIRKDEFEEFILGKLLSRVRKGDVRQWVAQVNSQLNQRWAAFERTAGERARTLADLEDRLANLLAVAEAGGDAPELADKIRETSDHISRLRRLENAQKPALLTADAVTGCTREIETALSTGGLEERKSVVKNYVVELVADPENQTVSGTLIDPSCPINDNGESNCDESNSPVCRKLVGQGLRIRTALHSFLPDGVIGIPRRLYTGIETPVT